MRLDPPGQTLTRCPNPAPGASHETIVWIALASMIACAKEPAPVDIVEINRLSALRDSVGQELKDLVAESGESASSVIGALRGSRHEALATTDAFLRQRIEALRGGVTFRHSETSPPIDTRRADSLAREVQVQRDSIAAISARLSALSPHDLMFSVLQMQLDAHRTTAAFIELGRVAATAGIDLRAQR